MSDFDTSDLSTAAIDAATAKAYGTPAPKQSASSAYAPQFAAAASKYGIDQNLLQAVAQTESSGNPNATSKDANGNPVAHGLMQLTTPTASALGVDPYNPGQAIDGAARLLKQNLTASNGDVQTALKMYHGGTDTSNWGPKTAAYPGKVQSNMPSVPAAPSDPFADFNIASIDAATAKAYGTNQNVSSNTSAIDKTSPVNVFANAQNNMVSDQAKLKAGILNTAKNIQNEGPLKMLLGGPEAALSVASGIGSSILGGWRGLANTGISLAQGNNLDQALREGANQVNQTTQQGTYQPQTTAGQVLTGALGIPGGVINELTGNFGGAIGSAVNGQQGRIVGEELAPAATNMILTGMGGASALKAAKALPATASASVPSPRLEPTMGDTSAGGSANTLMAAMKPRFKLNADGSVTPIDQTQAPIAQTETPIAAGTQAAQTQPTTAAPTSAASTIVPAQAAPLSGVGAAKVNLNPYASLTGQETVRGDFPQVKASKIGADVPSDEQSQRATIANEILGDVNKVRTGVVTGNLDTLKTENLLATAPNPTPAGQILKQQFADEQNALSNYAKQRVDATGSNPNFQNDYQRGQFVNNVMTGPDGLTGYINGLKKQVYDQAKATVGNNPVPTTNLDALLSDPKFQAELKLGGQKDFTGGLEDLTGVMKNTGFTNAPPNSIAAMEELRKALNAQWSPSNKYGIGKAVAAIDADVSSAGGPGLYEQGRAIHQTEKNLFSSPGIKSLFGDVDPNGVQTATPFEKIPDKLNNMPIDQWSHVHNTLDSLSRGQIPGAPENMPSISPELQQAAAQAKNEVAGMLARKVYEAGANKAGMWNQNSANNVLNSTIGDKIKIAMPPEEVQNFHTLNLGGQIMPGELGYEGAGKQGARMEQQGLLEKHAAAAGATLGGLTGSPIATWIGGKFGEAASAKAAVSRQMKSANRLNEAMEANSQLGKNPLTNNQQATQP